MLEVLSWGGDVAMFLTRDLLLRMKMLKTIAVTVAILSGFAAQAYADNELKLGPFKSYDTGPAKSPALIPHETHPPENIGKVAVPEKAYGIELPLPEFSGSHSGGGKHAPRPNGPMGHPNFSNEYGPI